MAANITFFGDPGNKSAIAGVTVTPGTKAVGDDAAGTVTVASGAPDAFLPRNLGGLGIVCAKVLADRALLAKGQNGTGMIVSGAVSGPDRRGRTGRAGPHRSAAPLHPRPARRSLVGPHVAVRA